VALGVLALSCNGAKSPTREMPPSSTTEVPASSTVDHLVVRGLEVDFLPTTLTDRWSMALHVPYGSAIDEVGNGTKIGENLGPEVPILLDALGRWWVSDTYKERIAVFDLDGSLVDEIHLPARSPVSSMRQLTDGRVVGVSNQGRIAVIDGQGVSYHMIGEENVTLLDVHDTTVFGFPTVGDRFAIDFSDPTLSVEPVDYVAGRGGQRYLVSGVPDDMSLIRVELPDANPPVQILIDVVTDEGGPVVVIPEGVSDLTGRLHILLFGVSDASPEVQRGLYLRFSSSGALEETVPVPDPLGDLDDGSLGHLDLDAEGNALLSVIDADGVRVWKLEPA